MASKVAVQRGDRGPALLPADDVATRFEACVTERGPVGVPIDARSWAQVRDGGTDARDPLTTVSIGGVGEIQSYATTRAIDRHFAEGGSRVVLSRVVGPAARAAVLALRDGSSGTVLTATANGPGAWYHGLRITVTRGTGDDRIITVTLGGATLSTGTARDADDAADILAASGYMTGVPGAGTWPIAAISETALAGGDDDRANITPREVDAALDVFGADLGPGALCASAWTTVAHHTSLATRAHAVERRQARGDMPDVRDVATLVAHAAQIRALGVPAGWIKLLAGYPLQTIGGVQVPVAPSGWITGREARADRENGPGPAQPAAWTFGELATASGISQRWTDDELDQLVAAGITPLTQDRETGAVWAYDSVTAADPARYPQYAQDACMRVVAAIHTQIERVLKQFVMQTMVDSIASAAEGACVAICETWLERRGLTDEAGPAYSVTVEADQARRSLTGYVEVVPTGSVESIKFTLTQTAPGGN